MSKRLLLVALLAASAACTEGDPVAQTPAPGAVFTPIDPQVDASSPLAAADLCLMYAVSSNTGGYLCQQAYVFTTSQADPILAENVCRPGTAPRAWADRLLAAVDAGRVAIDWALARECFTSSVDLRLHNTGIELAASGDLTALGAGVCDEFYSGLVKDGGACLDDWECADPAHGCYTDTPTTANSRTCRRGAGDGQSCNPEYMPCRDGFFCNDGFVCEALHELDTACVYSSDCRSGTCVGSRCVAPPTRAGLGDACQYVADCAGLTCATCRAPAPQQPTACALLGSQGDYCEDSSDCVRDLGCTNNTCTTVGPFAECAGTSTNVCHPNLDCVDMDGCLLKSGNEAACAADERCEFDSYYGYCFPRMGRCVALPVAGPCVEPVGYCAAGFWCDDDTDTCQPFARQGETCVSFGQGYSTCIDGYRCAEGVCELICLSDHDCTNDEVCRTDPNDSTLNACVPAANLRCTRSSECGDDRYCLFPEDLCFYEASETTCNGRGECDWERGGRCENTQICSTVSLGACGSTSGCQLEAIMGCAAATDCSIQTNDAGCNAVAGCFWSGVSCLPDCAEFDGDAAQCAANVSCTYSNGLCNRSCTSTTNQATCETKPLCEWRAVSNRCDNTFDCEDVATQGTCTGNGACAWVDTSSCQVALDAVSRCADKLPTGDEVEGFCDVGQAYGYTTGPGNSDACESFNCGIDDPRSPGVCTEPSNYGCYSNDYVRDVVPFAFVFGLMWTRRRKTRAT